MLDKSYYEKTDEIIEIYGKKPGSLIPIMQDIQAEFKYLSPAVLELIAIFALETVLWVFGVKPNEIEMDEEEWP